MDMGSFRGNKYEVRAIQLGPNQLGVIAVEHGVTGVKLTPRELDQGLFTEKESAQLHEAFSLVERVFGEVIEAEEQELELSGLKVARDKVHELLNAAQTAKKEQKAAELETARISAENLVKRAEAEELDRNLSVLRTVTG